VKTHNTQHAAAVVDIPVEATFFDATKWQTLAHAIGRIVIDDKHARLDARANLVRVRLGPRENVASEAEDSVIGQPDLR
jgi:hypothetical protein